MNQFQRELCTCDMHYFEAIRNACNAVLDNSERLLNADENSDVGVLLKQIMADERHVFECIEKLNNRDNFERKRMIKILACAQLQKAVGKLKSVRHKS